MIKMSAITAVVITLASHTYIYILNNHVPRRKVRFQSKNVAETPAEGRHEPHLRGTSLKTGEGGNFSTCVFTHVQPYTGHV